MDEYPDIYVSLIRYTILLVVEDGVVVDAPPIARWTIGKDCGEVLRYYCGKPDAEINFVW